MPLCMAYRWHSLLLLLDCESQNLFVSSRHTNTKRALMLRIETEEDCGADCVVMALPGFTNL